MRPSIGFKRVYVESWKTDASAMTPRPGDKMARWNGEPKRTPKKGELFISGAVPVAYKAKADMTTEYFIAVVVQN